MADLKIWHEAVAEARLHGLPAAGPQLFIALDIDGTLLRHDTSVSPRIVAAIQAHLTAGTHIVICTGRGISGAQIAMQDLGINSGYAVCANGAIIVTIGDGNDGVSSAGLKHETVPLSSNVSLPIPTVRLLTSHTFDPRKEIELISQALPQALISVESVQDVRRVNREFPAGEMTGKFQVLPVSELAHPYCTRLTIRTPDLSGEELLARIDALGLHAVEYAIGWSAWMDISPKGVTKATGLADVLGYLNLPREHTVAIGDSGNDCEMLAWAQLGVAMGNAPEYVRAHANAITEDVDHDGAALVLAALL
ncbi:HAD family hydrolase [Arcanobacterium hippocoleae]|uniref:HAD family hydrolase n=1 Tax=Arcanobacterium hippocoleae TaxID=149017 RepID=UPI00333E7817